jgi:hypothetical protein
MSRTMDTPRPDPSEQPMTAEDREAIAATFTNAVAVFSAWVHLR